MMRLRDLLVLLLCAVSLLHFVHMCLVTLQQGFADMPIFLDALQQHLAGGSLYPAITDPRLFEPGAAVFKFPPLYLLPYLPFVAGGEPAGFYTALWVVNIFLYASGVLLCMQALFRQASWVVHAGAITVACLFTPFLECLFGLTFEILLFFLLSLVLWQLSRTGRFMTSGLALAAMMKIYPATMSLYLLFRDRVALFRYLFAAAVFVMLAVLAMGLDVSRQFYAGILPQLMQELPLATHKNLAFVGVLLLKGMPAEILPQTWLAFRLVLLLGVVSLLWFSSRRPATRERLLLEFAFMVCVMLMWLPNSWFSYQLVLLLPVFILFRFGVLDRAGDDTGITLLLVAVVPLFFSPQYTGLQCWLCERMPGQWQLSVSSLRWAAPYWLAGFSAYLLYALPVAGSAGENDASHS